MSDPPKDLDPLAACDRLMFYQGAAMSALYSHPDTRQGQTAEELWNLIPFVKALAKLARRHEAELLEDWKVALEEPMPLGMPALGLPKGPTP